MFIWAHRGASGQFPENTLLAFEQAIAQNCDGIELDVFQVEDELYVWHDRYLPVQVGQALLITQQSKQLLNSVALPESQKIPTLLEALQCIAGRVTVNVEIKHIEDLQLLQRTLHSACRDHQFTPQQLLVSSFDHQFLTSWAQLDEPCLVGVLTASTLTLMTESLMQLRPYSVHFDINCLDTVDVEYCRSVGLKTYVYTVDQPPDLQQLLAMKVDGVFTNYPRRSADIIAKRLQVL